MTTKSQTAVLNFSQGGSARVPSLGTTSWEEPHRVTYGEEDQGAGTEAQGPHAGSQIDDSFRSLRVTSTLEPMEASF